MSEVRRGVGGRPAALVEGGKSTQYYVCEACPAKVKAFHLKKHYKDSFCGLICIMDPSSSFVWSVGDKHTQVLGNQCIYFKLTSIFHIGSITFAKITLFFPSKMLKFTKSAIFLSKTATFYKNYSFFIKNYIDPTYKKRKPQISPFIIFFGNNKRPLQQSKIRFDHQQDRKAVQKGTSKTDHLPICSTITPTKYSMQHNLVIQEKQLICNFRFF